MKMESGGGWLWVAGGLLVGILLTVVTVLALTRTDPGREEALEWTLARIGGRLSGELAVERASGNLLTGAKLYGLSLRGLDGEPLLLADSAFIEYRLPTFLGGDVVIQELTVFDGELRLLRMPDDTLWNYQKILQDPTPSPDTTLTATLLEEVRLVAVNVHVRLPWEPDADLPAPERERVTRAALADTSRLVVHAVNGGYLREIRFAVHEASAREVIISPDERGGTFLDVLTLDARAWLWDGEPLRIVDARGEVGLLEGVVRFDVPHAELPGSTARIVGVVQIGEGEPRYDLRIESPEFAMADMQWLFPHLPREGQGQVSLWWETRPDGTLFLARELDLDTPDSRVVGDFGVIIDGEFQVVEADLRASPITSDFLDSVLPAGFPVEGLRIEELEVTGG